MEFEAWWLLVIPLFFGLGWAAARIDLRGQHRQSYRLPDAYFRGLNFLLNEQPDRAIDAFIDVVRIEPDTVELHFALGNLFRRRGESDRAIRVHQNLVERADLAPEQREQALFELGQDYLKAGLIDRAEDVFNRLEGSRHATAALTLRLEIAQRVRDWPSAIELSARLGADASPAQRREVGHFHCELATTALAGDDPGRFEAVAHELDLAFAADPAHPRAWVLRGQAAALAGRHESAIEAWRTLARHSMSHLALVAADWLRVHQALGRLAEGIATLASMQRAAPSVDVLTALIEARAARDGAPAALRWAQAELQRTPSLLGLDALLALSAQIAPSQGLAASVGTGADTGEVGDPTITSDDVALTRRLIHDQSQRLARYVCGHCGFKARQFHWQCPGCSRWDAYIPRRAEELERG
jgi:lipopolysaccharide biosynthesis regulator YciM